jgi:hypothetical protein
MRDESEVMRRIYRLGANSDYSFLPIHNQKKTLRANDIFVK